MAVGLTPTFLCYNLVVQGETPHFPPKGRFWKIGILPSTGTPFTEAQLEAAFDKVADPADWRNPIYQVVDRDDVHVTVCAVRHFTAAPIEVIDLQWGDEFMVKSPGYRLGPAGA